MKNLYDEGCIKMKRLFKILVAGLFAMSTAKCAFATETTLRQPDSAGGGGASVITSTTVGASKAMDVNLTGGTITLTTPAYSITSGEFKVCTIPPTSAAACNLAATSTAFVFYNGSTTGTVYVNPFGAATASAGFPITKSGVAYDHYFGLTAFTNKNWSVYNADSATATVMLFGGK